jgi:hypothetical protein
VTLTTHPHLVPRSWMSRSYTSSPPQAPPWRVEGLLYLLYFLYDRNSVWGRGQDMAMKFRVHFKKTGIYWPVERLLASRDTAAHKVMQSYSLVSKYSKELSSWALTHWLLCSLPPTLTNSQYHAALPILKSSVLPPVVYTAKLLLLFYFILFYFFTNYCNVITIPLPVWSHLISP